LIVAVDAVSRSCEFLSHIMRKILFCHRGPGGFIFTHAPTVALIIPENAGHIAPSGATVSAQGRLIKGGPSHRERAGGEGRCAPCAHAVAPKGLCVPARGTGDPHPNPLPEGEGTTRKRDGDLCYTVGHRSPRGL